MSVNGHRPLPLERLGGLRTLEEASSVPLGWSPDCPDVEFLPGLVRTRPGLTPELFDDPDPGANINGLFNYHTPELTSLALTVTNNGTLVLHNPEVAAQRSNLGNSALWNTLGSYPRVKAVEAFDQAWLALGDGKHGLMPAFRLFASAYNKTEFDPAFPEGPYADGMTLADGAAGNISAGTHLCVVIYVTRSGYFTKPSNSKGYAAAGANACDVANITRGPGYVLRRILAFTIANGAEFYYLPGTVGVGGTEILDNTTTSVTVDFTDQQLLQQGISVDHLFRRISLSDPAGVAFYGDRLGWWGCRNSLAWAAGGNATEDFRNLSFNAGQEAAGGPVGGWVSVVAGGVLTSGNSVDGGMSWLITGDGTTPRGHLRQAAFSATIPDFHKVIEVGKNYKVRAFIYGSAGIVTGRLRIRLEAGGVPITTVGLSALPVAGQWQAFEARLWSSTDTAFLAAVPSLNVFAENLENLETIYVQRIDIFPEDEPFQESTIYVSNASDPEAIDGTNGFIEPASGEGQAVRDLYELRYNLYIAKERSLHVTQDNGETPDQWSTAEVSERVGAVSTRGTADGDEWNVLANRQGLFLHTGGIFGEENRLSLEIQPTWDTINWEFGHRLEVLVDVQRKRILVSAPVGAGQTTPNRIFMLDYTEGLGIEQRKWSLWNIAAGSMGRLERADGTEDILIGNQAANRKTYRLDSAAFSDDGAAINSSYQTSYFSAKLREQFGYLTMRAFGAGQLSLDVFRGDEADVRSLRAFTLPADERFMLERQLNIQRSAAAFRVGTNRAGEHFTLTEFTPWVQPSVWSPVRGR